MCVCEHAYGVNKVCVAGRIMSVRVFKRVGVCMIECVWICVIVCMGLSVYVCVAEWSESLCVYVCLNLYVSV